MLTIEYNKNDKIVEIHFDEEGIAMLINELEKLNKKKEGHFHFMTPSWGGFELSEKACGIQNEIINQINVGFQRSNKNN